MNIDLESLPAGSSGALFTAHGRARTLLWRVPRSEGHLLGVIMKNPSNAGVTDDDPTVRVAS